jgi:hypothetical protein
MATIKMPQAVIDSMAQAEADALLEGLHDEELRKNPAFLAKVRQFLKDNDFVTTTETEGVEEIIRDVHNIPDLVGEDTLQ